MPVIDGVFIPRTPLAPAELHVDWTAHNDHIVARRKKLERDALRTARRVALLSAQHSGFPTAGVLEDLVQTFQRHLDKTAYFGYTSAVAEITQLRAHRGHVAKAGLVIPDAGRFAFLAARGLAGVSTLVARRALETANAIAEAVTAAIREAALTGQDILTAAQTAATKTTHLHVLELVGETLNLGRTAGALSLPEIPEFALRSEQLDRNTCEPCDELHGTIVQVGTPQFFAILPPIGCLGGGRCRGIMVFGDGPRDVRAPELLAA